MLCSFSLSTSSKTCKRSPDPCTRSSRSTPFASSTPSEHRWESIPAILPSTHPQRAQLTKPQLLSVLPLLVKHLGSDNYVCYTYAAISIERILFIKQGNQLLFAQADIHEVAPALIDALLKKVEQGATPEKVAENDYLMKCALSQILLVYVVLTMSMNRYHAGHHHCTFVARCGLPEDPRSAGRHIGCHLQEPQQSEL